MVHVKKQERATLWAYLLNEGVCAVKQTNCGKHEATKIDNLKVWNVLRSMESRGFSERVFAWEHRYYSITESGCAYLRGCLGITKENVVPKTHHVSRPQEQPQAGRGGFGEGRGGFGEGRGRGEGRGNFRGSFNGEARAPEAEKELAKPQTAVAD